MKHIVAQKQPCFACGKMLKAGRPAYGARVVGEDSIVWVGADCYRQLLHGDTWQPPKGGPSLTVRGIQA
jgi:hypothetical protein